MSHMAMSIPLMAWVMDPPRPIQNVLACSFSLTFRFQGILAQVERLQHLQRAAHQSVVGEGRTPTGDAFVGEHRDQRVDAVLGADLVGPSTFRRAVTKASRTNA